MEFEWDETKRLRNVDKHGLDFIDAWRLFTGDHIVGKARPGGDDEERRLATGLIHGLYATVIYTVRGNVVRIISLRRARTDERRRHQALHGGGASDPD